MVVYSIRNRKSRYAKRFENRPSVHPEITMLMEQLFSSGVLQMGPSRIDPARQVGIFSPAAIAGVAAVRAAELDKLAWLNGAWNHDNAVPATRVSPPYSDIGKSRFARSKDGMWICAVAPDGTETPQITFDPFSKQWIYVLTRGSYGILRSTDGWSDNRIVFSGLMTMIGINCEWRMSWTRHDDDNFSFTNEERLADGTWAYIDEWHFRRKR